MENGRSESRRRALEKQLRGGNRKKRERKKRRLSSQNQKRSGRKKAEEEGERPKAKAKGKHRWNSCGSEIGRDERKQTEKPSTRTVKESMRDQAGENGENGRSESGRRAPKKQLRGGNGKKRKGRRES